jgi:hypothetical protein
VTLSIKSLGFGLLLVVLVVLVWNFVANFQVRP